MTVRSPLLTGAQWLSLTQQRTYRAILLMFLVTIPMTAIAFRLAHLQLVEGTQLRQRAEQNRRRAVPLVPARGVMLDRHGKILAGSRLTRSAYLSPNHQTLTSWRNTLATLEDLLDRPIDDILAEIQQFQQDPTRDLPIRIIRDLSPEGFVTLAELDAESLGIFVRSESSRYYPDGDVAAHVLGYVGEADPDDIKAHPELPYGAIVGRSGLERVADDRLRGTWGYDFLEVNAQGNILRQLDQRQPTPGETVPLTLDLALQKTAAEALGDRRGAVVALDPRTGAILAMVSRPSFDPNWFTRRISADQWQQLQGPTHPLLNRTLQGYPPGSTFKIVTAAAGMQTGQYNPASRLPTFAAISLGGHLFREHSGSYGVIGFVDALAYSSNTFFYQIGMRIGPEPIAQWGKALGIGVDYELGLAGARTGSIPTPDEKQALYNQPWYGGDTVSMAIGQGLVLATPLELAVMVGAIANGGQRVVPHFLADQTNTPATAPQATDIDPKAIAVIRQGLVEVVRKGTARNLNDGSIPLSGGKTGTSEVTVGNSNAMFVGFAPADQPEIAIAVAVENGGYGGAVAAPIAKAVYQTYFRQKSQ